MNYLKNSILHLFAGIFLLLLSCNVFSQSCNGFHHEEGCRIKNSRDYNQYGQARSAVLEVYKTYMYNVIFYGKKDYKLQICTESGYYPIHFRLLNAETKDVFYDNAEDDYIESVGFIVDENTPMIIEITNLAEGLQLEDGRDMRSCVGIQILWRKTPTLGF